MSTKRIHPNSRASWRGLKVSARERLICEELANTRGGMTDRELMQSLGFAEKNSVSPSVTLLKDRGIIREIDKTKCPTTGKTVRIVALVSSTGSLFDRVPNTQHQGRKL